MNNQLIDYTTRHGDVNTLGITYIGKKDKGIDGIDLYFDFDFGLEEIDKIEIDNWFRAYHYYDNNRPGGKFYTDYVVQTSKYDGSSCTVIVCERFDV